MKLKMGSATLCIWFPKPIVLVDIIVCYLSPKAKCAVTKRKNWVADGRNDEENV
jgi:hypothetical protein